MATLTKVEAILRIKEIRSKGIDDLKKIRAYLVLEDYTNKVIEEAIKELGLTQKRTEGLSYADILEWFGENAQTEYDLYDLILSKGTKNEARWINDRNKIRLLSVAIYKKGGYDFTEEAATKEQKAAIKDKVAGKATKEEPKEEESSEDSRVKAAWDKLNKAKAAWAKGKAPRSSGSFHPDKVSFLDIEALTSAYTKFFQDLTA